MVPALLTAGAMLLAAPTIRVGWVRVVVVLACLALPVVRTGKHMVLEGALCRFPASGFWLRGFFDKRGDDFAYRAVGSLARFGDFGVPQLRGVFAVAGGFQGHPGLRARRLQVNYRVLAQPEALLFALF